MVRLSKLLPRRTRDRWLAAGVAVAAAVSAAAVALPTLTGIRHLDPQSLNDDRPVAVGDAVPEVAQVLDRGPQFTPREPTWPAATEAEVALPPWRGSAGRITRADLSSSGGGPARLGDSPVWLAPGGSATPATVRARLHGRQEATKVGADALLISLNQAGSAGGQVALTVDIRGFAKAYGGDWATRLRFTTLPGCALTTPSRADCRRTTPVPTVNDADSGLVTGRVALARGGTVLALSAGAGGPAGTFAATNLQASLAWSGGAGTGEFNWSYPMRTPPSLGGPAPSLGLSYSSGNVDGRTAAENSQPSWIGEGFEFGPGGFIERRYVPCALDMAGGNNSTQTGDQCWLTAGGKLAQQVTLSLGSGGGQLIQDNTNQNRYHSRNEDGSLIERRTGGPNGDDDGEFWLVTTVDGTQYWFGGRSGSNAVLTMPVFGNHTDEPCRATTFAASSCYQAYRWNLDYVVDTHGNTMTYTYAQETNAYAKNLDVNTPTSYARDAYLTRIEYGTHTTDPAGTKAPATVDFEVVDRCLAACWSGNEPVRENWSDTPWDQRCTTAPCDDLSPTFYSSKRLRSVTTSVWDAGTSRYRPVERWTFTHSFPEPNDGTRAGLFLERISHQGLVGSAQSVPDVTFSAQHFANRVNVGDGRPDMNWARIRFIKVESGAKIAVDYHPVDCQTPSRLPNLNSLHNNTLRCFPARWRDDAGVAQWDFYHKYVVKAVAVNDSTGGAVHQKTNYDYQGLPAWRYSDDVSGLVKDEDKTWSVWRGYPTVVTTEGDLEDATTVKTQTVTDYFRGMHGDKQPSGTRTVSMGAVDFNGDGDTSDPADVPAANDEDGYAGLVRRTIVRSGVNGAEVSSAVHEPWQSGPTASMSRNGVTVESRFKAIKATHNRVWLDSDSGRRTAGWRTTSSVSTFDGFGLPTQVDNRGDDAVSNDESCTITSYARDAAVVASPVAAKWLMGFPYRVRDYATSCTTATTSTTLTVDDVAGDDISIYDNLAVGAPPTKGNVTESRILSAWTQTGQVPTYQTVSSAAQFDKYGRPTSAKDVRGNVSTTAYTPASGGPLTGFSVTNHRSWTTSTVLEPAWGQPTRSTDANGRQTNQQYDPLGRLLKVWLPGRDTAQPADTIYEYKFQDTAPSVITTKAMGPNGGYLTTYEFLDSLLRPRQTQTYNGTGAAGRMVTDIFYDSAGRPYLYNNPYLVPGSPSDVLSPPPTGDVPSQLKVLYDGVGRTTAKVELSNNAERWRTTIAYAGDRTEVTPPDGGFASATIYGTRGETLALRQYQTNTPTGTFDTTTYKYNGKSQLIWVTDPLGNRWTSGYDFLGRPTTTSDPDKGTSTIEYNQYGDVVKSKDARNKVLAFTYDDLGRQETMRDDTATGPLRARWYYEGLPDTRGLLTKSIRYDGANEYISELTGVTTTYKPDGVKYTIPSSEVGLAGTYQYGFTYYTDDSPETIQLPDLDGAGGMPAEVIRNEYNSVGAPDRLLTSGGQTYVDGTTYTSYGEVDKITMQSNAGPKAYIQYGYDYGTRRLNQIKTTRDTAPTTVTDIWYAYNKAGMVTSIKDVATSPNDTQCFRYDYLQRMTEAWTPAVGDCGPNPTVAGLGGPAKYWYQWEYDKVGNRKKETEYGTTAGTRTTTYNYPTSGLNVVRPHAVQSTSTVDNTGTKTATYGHDVAGNMISRPPTAGTVAQTLTWDAEGNIASVLDNGNTTTFQYDANGGRLIRRDGTTRTLYLPGQELKYTTSTGAKSTTRYYSHAGRTVAMRTTAGVVWLSADHHGTSQATINASGTQAVAIRRETPFGKQRGATGTWPGAMDKGFVGGTKESFGLTQIGARLYDPGLGRFISDDPVTDPGNPQQLNGYAYSNNSPASFSDPTGLNYDNCTGMCLVYGQHYYAANGNPNPELEAKLNQQQAGNELQEIKAKKKVAEQESKLSLKDVLIREGLTFLLDIFGVTDIVNCFTKGDLWACANALLNFIPIGKIFTMGRKIWNGIERAFSAFKNWRRIVAKANEFLATVDGQIAAAQRAFDQAAERLSFVSRKSDTATGKSGGGGGGGGASGGSKPGCHSFDPETQVLMADGSTKAIKDVAVGDKVVATDPETGRTETRTVTHLHINQDRDLTDLTVTTADGESHVLHTTQHHPFWDDTAKRWVDAKDLGVGHRLLVYADDLESVEGDGTGAGLGGGGPGVADREPAEAAVVSGVRNFVDARTMRDLTVADIHTYYVIAGNASVLVHNCDDEIDFAHGTTTEHADSIEANGLNSSAAAEASHRGQLSQSGNLFTYRVDGPQDPNLGIAQQWGVTRNGGFKDGASFVIVRMCRCKYDQLVREGHIKTRVTGEGMPEETIFGPEALPHLKVVANVRLS